MAKKISELTAATAPAETDVMPIVQAAATKKATVSAWVRGALLTGLSTATNAAIAATDSVLVAMGKLQAQLNKITTAGWALVSGADAAAQRTALGIANHDKVTVDVSGNVAIPATSTLRDLTVGDVGVDGDRLVNIIGAGGSRNFGISLSGTKRVWANTSASGDTHVTNGDGFGLNVSGGGHVQPGVDNSQTLGTASYRWSSVYAGTGTINTSDAREKTRVRPLTAAEINASKQLAAEIGAYKWLAQVAAKGDAAREHIGLTVQRAIEIMESCGLDPFEYGFICFDEWDDVFIDHPAIEAKEAQLDDSGKILSPAIEAKEAWTEQKQAAGSRYSFRPDELLLFISRGFEARLAALEAK